MRTLSGPESPTRPTLPEGDFFIARLQADLGTSRPTMNCRQHGV